MLIQFNFGKSFTPLEIKLQSSYSKNLNKFTNHDYVFLEKENL